MEESLFGSPLLTGRLPDGRELLTVSELTRRVKEVLEADPTLGAVWVKGEISNFKHHSSGHMYFTLKDEKSRLKCVMFRTRNAALRFRPEDGLTVIAGGSIGLYEVAGEYQLYVNELYPAGQGALHLAFEQLKQKLEKEGLFDPSRKRPLPFLPRTVGVVTSPTGAAIRDILSVLRRRFPNVNILLAPAQVQGEGGPASVIRGIRLLNERDDVDVMIVGRGGGSLEELWTFNDEGVARAIAASRIPVISAVGHETDFTISDFVADRRAPTPSAAAEMAVPEKATLLAQLAGANERLRGALKKQVLRRREALRYLQRSPAFTRPLDRIYQRRQHLDDLLQRAGIAASHGMAVRRSRLEAIAGKLDTLSPLATLARGYAICMAENGSVVTDAAAVSAGEPIVVRVHRGEIRARVSGEEKKIVQPSLPME